MHFRKLKTIATSGSRSFRVHQIRVFGRGSAPDPAGGAYSAQQRFKRETLLLRGKGEKGRGEGTATVTHEFLDRSVDVNSALLTTLCTHTGVILTTTGTLQSDYSGSYA